MTNNRIVKFNDNQKVGDYYKPYIVAELNTSHFGNTSIAKKMILKAKESGCDCIKLQSWKSGTLYSKDFFDKNPISKKFLDKYSLNNSQLKELAIYAKKIGISFSSTPYSEEEVNFLVNECNPAFVKIASMDLNNFSFLKFIAKKKVPIILSTGMGTIKEIESAIKLLIANGQKNICVLHCVSLYPLDHKIANLKNITMLRKKFKKVPIGYSDHSIGNTLAISSVALGACVIEKHFTLDNKKIGLDNHMATEPNDMKILTSECLIAFNSLGKEKRLLSKQEFNQRKKMRRSIFARESLKKNEKITLRKILLRRPGEGIPPSKLATILGKKVKKDIKKNSLFKISDIII
ncbi:N-acetylneuraminate synthase family protein [Candidatus Pelagibacter ubique]|nr:N-acetylneuraminate synthase family protein [Candidatus Pelagibacter ubique]